MNKKSIFTALLALVTLTGWAQSTKMATVTGYSPALKDGTLVLAGIGISGSVVDTVQSGRFAFTLPVEELSSGFLSLVGEGCPNFSFSLMMKPDVTIKLTGTDCIYPLWKVESPIPEQQTLNRITEHCRDVIKELIQIVENRDRVKLDSISMELTKQQMDILSSLPVDAASLNVLWRISRMLINMKDFPYVEQLKDLEKSFLARAPKGFEAELAEIHTYIYPPQVLQVGDKAVDAELFDMQGNTHHLLEGMTDGRYLLLDLWGIGCGPCRMAEPEMREVYKRMKDKLEIVGINEDKIPSWKNSDFSKRIVWKNWNDGKMGSSISSRYCDEGSVPYYVLISPDKRIVMKKAGYYTGMFLGLADAINGLSIKQDNSANFELSIRKVEANTNGTTVGFRYYSHKEYGFRIVKDSYLEANGKKYKVTAADGITLDETNYTIVKATDSTEYFLNDLSYIDFTLTFEPFDTIPTTFDFIEGDVQDAFVIRNVSVE